MLSPGKLLELPNQTKQTQHSAVPVIHLHPNQRTGEQPLYSNSPFGAVNMTSKER